MLLKSTLKIAAFGIVMHAHGVNIDASAEAATSLKSQLEQTQSSTDSLDRDRSRMNDPQRDNSWLLRRAERELIRRELLAGRGKSDGADEQDS